jgi:hypothetical protein
MILTISKLCLCTAIYKGVHPSSVTLLISTSFLIKNSTIGLYSRNVAKWIGFHPPNVAKLRSEESIFEDKYSN